MKQILFIGSIDTASVLFGQSKTNEMKQVLDTVISRSKAISYYSHTVNWDSLSAKMYSAADGAEELEQLKPAFEVLLNGLRDHHGQIRSMRDFSLLAYFTDFENIRFKDERAFDSEVWKVVNDPDSRFEHALMPNDVGYLKVVGVGPQVDGQKEVERMRKAIEDLHQQKVSKWIIDLRYNGGGNINVMLAGLAPLLDTKLVVSIQDQNEQTIATAEIREGNFWYRGVNAFTSKQKVRIKNPKIAILTSRWTTSSGEFVAVAFKGQARTRFFGEATQGRTTENSWEVINNQIALVISTGVYCDRNGHVYYQNVKPDEEVLFELEENREIDQGIIKAVNWLNESEK